MENLKIEIKEAENHLPNHQPLISESTFKYGENKLLGIDDSDALVCECVCVYLARNDGSTTEVRFGLFYSVAYVNRHCRRHRHHTLQPRSHL